MSKRKIFFDMDGTLTVFAKGDGMDLVTSPGYAKNREYVWPMIDAAYLLANYYGFEPWIASAVLPYSYSIPDKDYWIDHCPGHNLGTLIPKNHRVYIPYGTNKAEHLAEVAVPGDVFIDDFTQNLVHVHDYFDGRVTCIKVLNGINDTHHSWSGARISAFSDAETIALTIAGIADYAGRR